MEGIPMRRHGLFVSFALGVTFIPIVAHADDGTLLDPAVDARPLFSSSNIAAAPAGVVATDQQVQQAETLTASALLRLCLPELESIYRNGSVPDVPDGKLRGTVVVAPRGNTNRTMSRASRLLWQGKVFDQQCSEAVNKFFGMRLIKGQLSEGESWLDGKPALILDYRGTSLIYANVRDEIRQVAPGLYLGVMFEESCCGANFKTFFILESPCTCR
jgi:hypothetical protein